MNVAERDQLKGEVDRFVAIGRSRLTDGELEFLHRFVTEYQRFRNLSQTVRQSHRGFSSDGRYERKFETEYRFGHDEVSILVDWNYRDDDGQTGFGIDEVDMNARSVINWFREHGSLTMFDSVRDIVGLVD